MSTQSIAVEFADGIATLRMAMPGRANKVNPAFIAALDVALTEALGHEDLAGIIIASGHKDFCVGADLEFLYAERDPQAIVGACTEINAIYRRLETCGKPVVAALTGSALGGGYELALACHHRIALDDPRIQLGLPETTLGVIPGAGGTQRLPRLLGLQAAMELVAQGTVLRAPKALGRGLVDALAEDPDALVAAAKAWIAEHPNATQPWDRKGFEYPGGAQPKTRAARLITVGGSAMLQKKTAGAFNAPEAAIRAIFEGTRVDLDNALRIESRFFADIATSDQAKDMIRTLWFHKNAVDKQEGLPRADSHDIRTVGIIGAGMMGAGLAFVCAKAGFEVRLLDIAQDALDRGMAHIGEQIAKRAKHLDDAGREALGARIHPSTQVADFADCDLVIEAVFEDLQLKQRVIRETEAVLGDGALWASNTSAIPIDTLAEASARPSQFLGLHFFSPVEQMPLLEVVTGPRTDEATLARCLAFARDIKKTSIVVNDGYGFYTTRVFSAYVMEAATLVGEGYDPVVIEWAARQAGMVVPPLKVLDEVSLSLAVHGFAAREKFTGAGVSGPGVDLVKALVEAGRSGKAAGAGFYDYSTKPRRLWSGLDELVTADAGDRARDVDYITDRLLYAQALEAVRCLESGILRHPRDAEVGALLGVGFAPNTGGPLAWLDRKGAANAVRALDETYAAAGERFVAPEHLRKMAADGARFFD